MTGLQFCTVFSLALSTLLLACAPENTLPMPQPESGQPRPNILMIIADDLGYSDLGAFGGEIRTPNLDALASAGVRLTDFHVAPMCAPTRATLFTGVDHHRAGFGTMVELMSADQRGRTGYEGHLNERVVTIATLLKDTGYRTSIAGKWHLGRAAEHAPQAYGFDQSFVLMEGGASHFDATGILDVEPVATYREKGELADIPTDFYSSTFFTDKLIEFLEYGKHDQSPFFATLAFTAPHWPLHAPEEFIDRYAGDYAQGYDDVRNERLARMSELGLVAADAEPHRGIPNWPEWEDLSPELRRREARKMEIYAAMVEAMDYEVGRLIDHLKRTNQYDETIIVFMADNGADGNNPYNVAGNVDWIPKSFDNSYDNLGRPGSYVTYGPGWAQVGSTPFRLYKGFPTEGGIRAPAIIAGPGIANDKLLTEFITVTDLAPTLLEFAGVRTPDGRYAGRDIFPMSGTSAVRYLAGRADTVHPDGTATSWELLGRRAVRQGNWKLVKVESPFGTAEWELYDLDSDPGETNDIAARNAGIVEHLKETWEHYKEDNDVLLIERPPAYSTGLNYYTQIE